MLQVTCVIKGQFYKEIIGKLPGNGHFSYNSFVKYHGKKIGEPQHDCVISSSML